MRGLAELCRAGLDSVRFRRELRACLERWIGFDAYCVNTLDPFTRVVTSSIGDGLSQASARRLFELEVEGDVNPLASLAGVVTIGVKPERSARMREIFLPLGLRDELRAALSIDGFCWGYLHLFRQRPFEARDVERVERARVDIAGALRAAATHRDESAQAGFVLVDCDGVTVSETARAWLDSLDDVGGSIPHVLHALGPRIARHRGVTLHGSRFDRGLAIVLSRSTPAENEPIVFAAHGLTRRESEVARELARGRSNQEIATSLGIAVHTLKDHVKAILSKTRTKTRAEFAAMLGD